MYRKPWFIRMMFFFILACIAGVGAVLEQNITLRCYPWIIGDVVLLILLFVDAYLYAKEIK